MRCEECKQEKGHKEWCKIGDPVTEKYELDALRELEEKYSEDLDMIKEALKE